MCKVGVYDGDRVVTWTEIFFFFFLVVPGLRCGTWALRSSLLHVNS